MKAFSKVIGIVGGAGPVASSLLYSTLIEICQKQYGAHDYSDFPEIVLESFPFTRGNPEKIREEIALCFAKLKSAGASLCCVASHSFHGFLPDTRGLEFIHLVSESLREASRLKISKLLILASQTTIDLKLYESPNIPCVYPPEEDQNRIQSMIREVARGFSSLQQAEELEEMVLRLRPSLAFDGVMIACTELPLIYRKLPFDAVPVIDTIEVLARSLLSLC